MAPYLHGPVDHGEAPALIDKASLDGLCLSLPAPQTPSSSSPPAAAPALPRARHAGLSAFALPPGPHLSGPAWPPPQPPHPAPWHSLPSSSPVQDVQTHVSSTHSPAAPGPPLLTSELDMSPHFAGQHDSLPVSPVFGPGSLFDPGPPAAGPAQAHFFEPTGLDFLASAPVSSAPSNLASPGQQSPTAEFYPSPQADTTSIYSAGSSLAGSASNINLNSGPSASVDPPAHFNIPPLPTPTPAVASFEPPMPAIFSTPSAPAFAEGDLGSLLQRRRRPRAHADLSSHGPGPTGLTVGTPSAVGVTPPPPAITSPYSPQTRAHRPSGLRFSSTVLDQGSAPASPASRVEETLAPTSDPFTLGLDAATLPESGWIAPLYLQSGPMGPLAADGTAAGPGTHWPPSSDDPPFSVGGHFTSPFGPTNSRGFSQQGTEPSTLSLDPLSSVLPLSPQANFSDHGEQNPFSRTMAFPRSALRHSDPTMPLSQQVPVSAPLGMPVPPISQPPGFMTPSKAAAMMLGRPLPLDLRALGGATAAPAISVPHAVDLPRLTQFVQAYLSAPSGSLYGDRLVRALTPKVVQKSYGPVEKRFMCPPPLLLLTGSNWVTPLPDAKDHGAGAMASSGLVGPPPGEAPEASFSRDGATTQTKRERSDSRSYLGLSSPAQHQMMVGCRMTRESTEFHRPLRWVGVQGQTVDIHPPMAQWPVQPENGWTDMILAKSAFKQMAVSEAEQADASQRRDVQAEFNITVPSDACPGQHKLLGSFPSRPVRVISKPSKKRQSVRGTEMLITHGSIVSLFHRQRAQASSTKHLCVSRTELQARFKTDDSIAPEELNQLADNSFVAADSYWDPFIIYLADPAKLDQANENEAPSLLNPSGPGGGQTHPAQLPPASHGQHLPGAPSVPLLQAPANALPILPGQPAQAVLYNRPVVLQCVMTGLVTPTMVLRRVDKGTSLFGGFASVQGDVPGAPTIQSIQQGHGREPSDSPVLQLHKLALELYQPPAPAMAQPPLGPASSTCTFLSCLGDRVCMHALEDSRGWRLHPVPPGKSRSGSVASASGSTSSAAGVARSGSLSTGAHGPAGGAAAPRSHSIGGWDGGVHAAPGFRASRASVDASLSSPAYARRASECVPRASHGDPGFVSDAEPQASATGPIRLARRASSAWTAQSQRDRQASRARRREQSAECESESGASAVQSVADDADPAGPGNGAGLAASWSSLGGVPGDETAEAKAKSARIHSWALDVAKSNVWCIVGAETVDYTFSVPPERAGDVPHSPDREPEEMAEAVPLNPPAASQSAHSPAGPGAKGSQDGPLASPDTSLIAPITNFPRVHRALQSMDQQGALYLSVYGENLGPHLHVFVDAQVAPVVHVTAPSMLVCRYPAALTPPGSAQGPRPGSYRLLLVRHDGVIFPSHVVI